MIFHCCFHFVGPFIKYDWWNKTNLFEQERKMLKDQIHLYLLKRDNNVDDVKNKKNKKGEKRSIQRESTNINCNEMRWKTNECDYDNDDYVDDDDDERKKKK